MGNSDDNGVVGIDLCLVVVVVRLKCTLGVVCLYCCGGWVGFWTGGEVMGWGKNMGERVVWNECAEDEKGGSFSSSNTRWWIR